MNVRPQTYELLGPTPAVGAGPRNLLGRLMHAAQAGSGLDAEDAERLTSDELHASRRERRGAA